MPVRRVFSKATRAEGPHDVTTIMRCHQSQKQVLPYKTTRDPPSVPADTPPPAHPYTHAALLQGMPWCSVPASLFDYIIVGRMLVSMHLCAYVPLSAHNGVPPPPLTLSLTRWKSSRVTLSPAARDMAIKCSTALVEPPEQHTQPRRQYMQQHKSLPRLSV